MSNTKHCGLSSLGFPVLVSGPLRRIVHRLFRYCVRIEILTTVDSKLIHIVAMLAQVRPETFVLLLNGVLSNVRQKEQRQSGSDNAKRACYEEYVCCPAFTGSESAY